MFAALQFGSLNVFVGRDTEFNKRRVHKCNYVSLQFLYIGDPGAHGLETSSLPEWLYGGLNSKSIVGTVCMVLSWKVTYGICVGRC